MNTKTIIIGLVVIAVGAFGIQYIMNKKTTGTTTNTTPKTATTTKVKINDLGVFNSKDRADAVKRFAGKPTIIFIVGTFCPHCQSAMPTYKTDIWDTYKAKVNIFTNVSDGQSGKRFDVPSIPQGFDAKLDYKTLTGEDCNYVPSWVMLDAEGTVTDSSCGASKDITVIKDGLNAQLSN